ncbi:MAG: nucleotidyltransferase substrate binding protein [Verrucomicrobiota bacterium]|nr:nucleotidyltransferase substrate binding protein [Verrucomicrobiota bacterium]
MEYNGFTVETPLTTIKQTFQSDIITNGHAWIDALEDRNLTSHTYDEKMADKIVNEIKMTYFPLLTELH